MQQKNGGMIWYISEYNVIRTRNLFSIELEMEFPYLIRFVSYIF